MVESAFLATSFDDLFEVSASHAHAVAIMVAATVLYLAYDLAIGRKVVARLFPSAASEEQLRTAVSFFRKAVGTVLLGLVPCIPAALLLPGGLAACGLSLDEAPRSLLLAGGFVLLMLPLLLVQSRRPMFLRNYPEVRVPFTRRIALWNALGWTTYLLAYELFFRGFLVLGLAPHIGPLPALAASLMAYVFVHLGRYPGEVLGTLVTGSVFGLVALDTGSILMPFLAHLGVALTSDTLAARHLLASPDA